MKLYTADEYLKKLNAAMEAEEDLKKFEQDFDEHVFNTMFDELHAALDLQKAPPTPDNTESIEARLVRLEEKIDKLLAESPRPMTSWFPPERY